mmetsp:Transcript_12081/g.35606  ORF Transcript_12081/g.35606 Transcript_12081/m.35606 type:complete len:110 (+) Transcript_12081:1507-1836(+)
MQRRCSRDAAEMQAQRCLDGLFLLSPCCGRHATSSVNQVIEAADSEAQDSEAQDSEASDFPPTEQGSAPRKARPTLARQLSTWVEETVVGKLNEPKVGFYEIRVLPTFV